MTRYEIRAIFEQTVPGSDEVYALLRNIGEDAGKYPCKHPTHGTVVIVHAWIHEAHLPVILAQIIVYAGSLIQLEVRS